ncbi:MAG TPA: penicillin-binding protein 2 [Chloroflexi bacterium]|nr:penicillin-binding protein 2 [Chloroflexota bacterium]
MEKRKPDAKITVFRIIILLLFSLLALQTWRLQIVQGEESLERANRNRFRLVSTLAPRGVIYDRQGRLLVRNIPSFTVSVVPADLPPDREEEVIQRLASLLEMPVESRLDSEPSSLPQNPHLLGLERWFRPGIRDLIEEGRKTPFVPIILAHDVPREVAFLIEEEHLDLPGVVVQTEAQREYIDGPLLSHIIGYVGLIPEEEVESYLERPGSDYELNDLVGLTGVELTFEEELRGKKGRKHVEVDVAGREVRTVGAAMDPQPGYNLILTIDLDLQKEATEALQEEMTAAGSQSGVVVAMDPQTGEILALVSLPSYDNNLFIGGISLEDYQALRDHPHRPLVDHALTGQYPPGSIFKIVGAAAGLEERIINRHTAINCPGTIWLPHRFAPQDPSLAQPFRCWRQAGHGPLSVVSAIAQSCDIFFYTLAGGYREFQGLGLPMLSYYARLFGLGSPTGIDLPGESEGLIPSEDWKRLTYGEAWVTGDTYNMAIGQGYILTTPLQMLNATAAVANGGTLYRPQIVREVRDTEGNIVRPFRKEVIRQLPIAPENLALVQEGMRAAVAWGTAWRANLPGVAVAGKTGSAEYPGPRDREGRLPTHAWFVAYAPAEDPEIALVVFIEGGGEGSVTAAPVAARILADYFDLPLE